MTIAYASFVRLPHPTDPDSTVGYEVDSVDGDVVTLRKVGYSSTAPFFATRTVAEVEAHGVEARPASYRASFAPPGECAYCDRERAAEATIFPRHHASARCRSNGYEHCSCDVCF